MPLPAAAKVRASAAHSKLLSPDSFTPFSPSAMKSFLDALSNSGPAVRRYSEGGNRPTRRPLQENVVTQYLVAILPSRRLRPIHRGRSDVPRYRRAQRRDEGCSCQDYGRRPAEPGQHREHSPMVKFSSPTGRTQRLGDQRKPCSLVGRGNPTSGHRKYEDDLKRT